MVDLHLSIKNDSFLIATKKDIRILDCVSGLQSKILVNLGKEDEDLAQFLPDETEKELIIADNSGFIQVVSINNGKCIQKLIKHEKEVLFMKADNINRLIVTLGGENLIRI